MTSRYHMADNAKRTGSLWIHVSEAELLAGLAVAFSLGLAIGLAFAVVWSRP